MFAGLHDLRELDLKLNQIGLVSPSSFPAHASNQITPVIPVAGLFGFSLTSTNAGFDLQMALNPTECYRHLPTSGSARGDVSTLGTADQLAAIDCVCARGFRRSSPDMPGTCVPVTCSRDLPIDKLRSVYSCSETGVDSRCSARCAADGERDTATYVCTPLGEWALAPASHPLKCLKEDRRRHVIDGEPFELQLGGDACSVTILRFSTGACYDLEFDVLGSTPQLDKSGSLTYQRPFQTSCDLEELRLQVSTSCYCGEF